MQTLLGSLLLVVAAFAAAQSPDAAGGSSQAPITIGTELDYPPYSYTDENGRPAGFNVDVAEAVADAIGVPVRIEIGPWSEIREALTRGEVDAITGMFISAERDALVDFTPAMTVVTHAVFARAADARSVTVEALADARLLVMESDIMHDYVLEHELGSVVITRPTIAQTLEALEQGIADFALVAHLPGLHQIRELELGGIRATDLRMEPRQYAIAVREGEHELQTMLAEGLALIDESGALDEIIRRHLGPAGGRPWADVLRYVLIGTIGAVVLGMIAAAWIILLRREVARRTEALETEAAQRRGLQRSLEIASLIVEQSPAVLFRWKADVSWTVEFVSRNVTRFGYTPEAFTGGSIRYDSIIHPADRERVAKEVASQASSDADDFRQEYRLRDSSGEYRWVTDHTTVHRDERGAPLYFQGVVIDVHDQRTSAAALQVALDEKEVLLRELYHRTKNNMQVIASMVSLRRNDQTDPAVRNLLDEIQTRIYTMAIVHGMLYQSNDLSQVRLDTYLEQLTKLILDTFAGDSPVNVEYHTAPVSCLIDLAIPLGLVANELLTNAVKYGGSVLTIELAQREDRIILIIADDGPGIDWETVERGSDTLGIRTVRSIVEAQLGGSISATNDRGARWEIRVDSQAYQARV